MTTETATLNERLAKACGWQIKQVRHINGLMVSVIADGTRITGHRALPDYKHSIDAQNAPGGPYDLARAKGWRWNVIETNMDDSISAEIGKWRDVDKPMYISHTADTEAAARALCLVEALEREDR